MTALWLTSCSVQKQATSESRNESEAMEALRAEVAMLRETVATAVENRVENRQLETDEAVTTVTEEYDTEVPADSTGQPPLKRRTTTEQHTTSRESQQIASLQQQVAAQSERIASLEQQATSHNESSASSQQEEARNEGGSNFWKIVAGVAAGMALALALIVYALIKRKSKPF